MKKLVFTTKPFEGFLYKWSPEDNAVRKGKTKSNTNTEIKFCNAIPFSQGEDNVSTFCYRVKVEYGKIKKLAYVTCGYVK